MKQSILRVLVPVLGMVGLALVVQGVSAQETQDSGVRSRVARAPSVMSFRSSGGTYLGVYIREVSAEDRERLDLPEERGALITDVPEEGPADDAGLQADDVVISWNGSRIESAAQLRRMVGETPAGRTIDLGYIRDGRERSVRVELAERSGDVALGRVMELHGNRLEGLNEQLGELQGRLQHDLPGRIRGRLHEVPTPDGDNFRFFIRGGRLGVGIQNLGDQLAEYFGAEDGGVLVSSVSEDSPAEAAGLKAGDVIIGVGGDDVEDPGDLMEAIAEAEEGDIDIRILRDRRTQTLRATLPERDERFGNSFYFGPRAMNLEIPFGEGAFSLNWNDGELLDIQIPEMHFDFDMPEIDIPDFDVHVAPRGGSGNVVST